MAVLIQTRGPKIGQCNICGEHGALTEDHTPPKGCYKPRPVELFPIMDHLAAEPPRKAATISQNGVKYRTLCGRCNNTLLGAEYDPEFIGFVNDIGLALRTSLTLPNVLAFTTKPQRVIRSLLGHMSAQGVSRYRKGPNTEPIRDYILDPSLPLPENLKVYSWPYPYSRQVIVRDFGLVDLRVPEPVVCWFMKFFPVGFLVTFDEMPGYQFPGTELSRWRSASIDEEVNIPFALKPVPPQFWPEAPTDTSAVFYGKEAVMSFAKRR